MALIKIKQINNSPAATGGLIIFDGTNNVWSNNDDGAVQLSSGATGTRPAGSNGMIRYNSTLTCLEAFVDGAWTCLVSADGVSLEQIIGADSETSEPMLFIVDITRSNKLLSAESSSFSWGESTVGNDDWLELEGISDADSGYIMPYDGTIVRATGHTADDNGNTKSINMFIGDANGTGASAGTAGTFPGTNVQSTFETTNLDLNFSAGDKIRLRGDSASGTIQDTVATLWVKWRVA